MGRWESLVDQKIREAMEQGEFDNLTGKGEPIDLTENPYEDPDWRTAHRLLRNAGFAPAWIEERKDIESELEGARKQLSRAWTVVENARGTENESGAKVRWEKARSAFSAQATNLNKQIVAWNLKVPSAALHRKLIDAEREIERIREAVK
jgi:DnaJ homolog subfamily C member 28